LVASSCGYERGHIEPCAADEFAVHIGLNIAKLSRTAKGQHFAVKAYFRQSWG
jgi:hypothetical protein